MEINITQFFNDAEPYNYSGSVMEYGQDAGKITWDNAVEASGEYQLLNTEEERDAARRYFKGFGAWSERDIKAWSDVDLNALLIQYISGNMREADLHCNMTEKEWAEYEEDEREGRVSGGIFRGSDGQIYFLME